MSRNKCSKKQARINELENRDEAKRKAKSNFNVFKRILLKEEKKTLGKTTKQEGMGKTMADRAVATVK